METDRQIIENMLKNRGIVDFTIETTNFGSAICLKNIDFTFDSKGNLIRIN